MARPFEDILLLCSCWATLRKKKWTRKLSESSFSQEVAHPAAYLMCNHITFTSQYIKVKKKPRACYKCTRVLLKNVLTVSSLIAEYITRPDGGKKTGIGVLHEDSGSICKFRAQHPWQAGQKKSKNTFRVMMWAYLARWNISLSNRSWLSRGSLSITAYKPCSLSFSSTTSATTTETQIYSVICDHGYLFRWFDIWKTWNSHQRYGQRKVKPKTLRYRDNS